MPAATFTQTSFLGGEISQVAQGRTDLPTYRTAMNACLNGLPTEAGAWMRRPGLGYVTHTRGGVVGRLVPFAFKDENPYRIEFTDNYLRFVADDALAMTNDEQVVVSISSANPAKVATTTAHTWTSGNQVMFGDLGTSMPLLQNRQFVATVTSSTEFTLTDAITGATIDGSTLGALPAGATVQRILEVASPYASSSWLTTRVIQSVDITKPNAVLLNPLVKPYLLAVTKNPTPTNFAEFSLDTLTFKDGPYLDPVAGGAVVTPGATTGNLTLTISFPAYDATTSYAKGDFVISASVNYKSLIDQNLNNTPAGNPTKWLAVSAGIAVGPNGFLATDIGRMIRLYSEPPLWDARPGTVYNYSAKNVVAFNGLYWTALTAVSGTIPTIGNTDTNTPGVLTTTWAINPTGARWTWGRITALANAISGTLAGIAYIGDFSNGGGLTAVFDGNTSKVAASCGFAASTIAGGGTDRHYVGANYSGASDQKIGSVTVYPSSDHAYTGVTGLSFTMTFNLRGKASLPASATDGTLLGTYTASVDNNTPEPNAPVTIVSTDQATSWKYAWIEMVITSGESGSHQWNYQFSQVQFFNPTGTGSGTGITVQLLGDPLLYTSAIRVWRLGVYSDTTGWPASGTYHEGRLWLTGAVPNRIDGSKSNGISGTSVDFAPTAPTGAIADNNGISYVFNAADVNSVFWMLSEQQGIICGTLAGEWLVQATTQGLPLTPTNIQAHKVTHNGCANIEPRRTNLAVVYVQKFKHKLMEYFADVFSGKFASPNLSVLAKHLASRGLEEIAYQQELSPVVWHRCSDGSLIGASYKRESLLASQGPAFIGWHRHTLGSGRTVESICGGPSADGLLDTLGAITNDAVSGIRHVELLGNLWEEGDAITAANFLDNSVAPSSYTVTTTGGVDYLNLFGLWHLNGKTATVFAGGVDCGDFAVAAGTCAVRLPAGVELDGTTKTNLLTTALVNSYSGALPVLVGFSYTSDGQIVRAVTPQESGARSGPALGKLRRTHLAAFLLQDTQGIKFGTEFATAKMNEPNFTTPGGTAYSRLTLFSGIWRHQVTDSDGLDSMVCWRVTRPYPATIAAVTPFLETTDS